MFFSAAPKCEALWKPASTPLPGYTRPEPSRPILNEKTRVVSDANARSCRSNISFTCSSHESGTPAGAPGSSRVSPLMLRASIF
jgi:hypothetical protein